MNKKILIFVTVILVLTVVLGVAKKLLATQTADITVTVTVRKLSVSVSPATLAFGLVNEGTTTVAGSAIVVTNDGNLTENYDVKLTNPVGWTAIQSGSPSTDQYKLGAIFKTLAPVAGDFVDSEDMISTIFVTSSATLFAKNTDVAGEKGFSVVASATRNLWFGFFAPSLTTVGTQQSITVTLRAS